MLLALYFASPKAGRNALLLCASLLFYARGEGRFVLVLLLSVVLNYFFGLAVGRADSPGRRRLFRPTQRHRADHAPGRGDPEQSVDLVARDHRAGHPARAHALRIGLQQQRHDRGAGGAKLGLHGARRRHRGRIAAAGLDQLRDQVRIGPVLRNHNRRRGLERLEEEVAVAPEILGMVPAADDRLHRLRTLTDGIDDPLPEVARGHHREPPGLAVGARRRGDRSFEHALENVPFQGAHSEDPYAASAPEPLEMRLTVHSSLNPPSTLQTWPVT